MKMQFKKAMALGLVSALAALSLASCSGNAPSTGAPSTGSTVVPADNFKFYAISTGVTTEEFNANPLVAMLEEHTGYKVTYDQVPTSTDGGATAINNIFMNREDYQAIIVSRDQFYSLLAQDALKDLSPFIENAPNLKENVADLGWELVSKDGGTYGIPRKDALKVTNWSISYRLDWLNEYNSANPSKKIAVPAEENGYSMGLSDFKTMLEYFKSKVPQGGAAFHVAVNAVVQENIMPAFGISNLWSDVDGELTYYVNHPKFGEYVDYMQDLFDAGLIAYSATAEDPTTVKMMQADQLGAGRVFHWDAAAIEGAEGTSDKIGYMAALVADENKGEASAVRQFADEAYPFYAVVPKYTSDEQAAAVVDWTNKSLDEEFFRKLVLGEEGVTYTVENGAYWPILPEFNDQRGLSDRFLISTREADYGQYWLCRTRKTEAQNKLFSAANFNIINTGIKSPISVMPTNAVYDNSFSGAKNTLDTALVTTLFSNNRTSIEDLQKLYASNGGSDVDTAVNEWYAAWESKASFNTVE